MSEQRKTLRFSMDDEMVRAGNTAPTVSLLLTGLKKQAEAIEAKEDKKGVHGRLVDTHFKSFSDFEEVFVKDNDQIKMQNLVSAKVDFALTFVKDASAAGTAPSLHEMRKQAEKKNRKSGGGPESADRGEENGTDHAAEKKMENAMENAGGKDAVNEIHDAMQAGEGQSFDYQQLGQAQMDMLPQMAELSNMAEFVDAGVVLMQLNPYNTEFRAEVGQFLATAASNPVLSPMERGLAFIGAEVMADPNIAPLPASPVVAQSAAVPVVPLEFPPIIQDTALTADAMTGFTNAIPGLIGNFLVQDAMPEMPAAAKADPHMNNPFYVKPSMGMAPTPNFNDPAFGGGGVAAGSTADVSSSN
jgi:hypothetical protein